MHLKEVITNQMAWTSIKTLSENVFFGGFDRAQSNSKNLKMSNFSIQGSWIYAWHLESKVKPKVEQS